MTKTYAQLTREIQALQASAEKLRATETKAVIAKLNESIAAYGLTADDLRFPDSTAASTRRARNSSSASTRSNASTDAKYSDGQGRAWGGRGPRPAWLREAIAGGRSLESFETAGAAATSPGASGRASKRDGASSKTKLPALYGHPKTGHTWSGRGPKPAWLKQGLKKRGSSVEDFLLSAHAAPADAAPAATSGQPKQARAQAKPAATAKRPATAGKASAGKSSSQSKAAPAKAKATAAAPAKGAKTAPAKKTPAQVAPPAAASQAPAAKTASKAPAKPAAKPARKTASTPRKNLPASMAPPADAAPTPSTVPTAAPMPAAPSGSVEGRGDVAAS